MAAPIIDLSEYQIDGTLDINTVNSYKFYDKSVELFFDQAEHTYFRFENDERIVVPGVTTILKIIDKSFALVPWAVNLATETILMGLFDDNMNLRPLSTEEILMLVKTGKDAHKVKLEQAGDIGGLAHNAIEAAIRYALQYSNGVVKYTLPYVPENEKAAKCYWAAIEWMDKHNVRWIHTERKIYSKEYDYAGTLDGIALVDSCNDLKCCRGVKTKDRLCVIDWKSSNALRDEYALQTAAYLFAYVEETGEKVGDRWIIRLGKEDGEFEPWLCEPKFFADELQGFLDALTLTTSLDRLKERRKADKKALKALIKAEKGAQKAEALQAEKAAKAELKAAAKIEKEKAAQAEKDAKVVAKLQEKAAKTLANGTFAKPKVVDQYDTKPIQPTIDINASEEEQVGFILAQPDPRILLAASYADAICPIEEDHYSSPVGIFFKPTFSTIEGIA